ncbi:class I SAM-dependent methyltransferase [Ornithinicoccus halotolerans]|uniref:class I SAM-dependent methyltransferase n=1 Tax=Ornithinicoccus halotolerans TaxID=1748220 RepID=UPI0012964F9E|nr:class I SAM-dependent methyltransferase [Ornithinicoccus halotolerans]
MTWKHRGVALTGGLGGGLGALLAATGRLGAALAVLAVLLTGLLLLVLDLRRRQQVLWHHSRSVQSSVQAAGKATTESVLALGESLRSIGESLDNRVAEVSEQAARAQEQGRVLQQSVTDLGRRLDAVAEEMAVGLAGTEDRVSTAVASAQQEPRAALLRRLEERHQELLDAVSGSSEAAELKAHMELVRRLSTGPSAAGTTANRPTAAAVLSVVELIEQHHPEAVLSLGASNAAMWVAEALRTAESARLVVVDDDEHAVSGVARFLHERGLTGRASARHAPLTDVEVAGEPCHWYDTQAFTDLEGVDLVLLDGPAAGAGRFARYPAVPLLQDHLSEHALLVLFDVSRLGASATVTRWVHHHGLVVQRALAGDALLLTREGAG